MKKLDREALKELDGPHVIQIVEDTLESWQKDGAAFTMTALITGFEDHAKTAPLGATLIIGRLVKLLLEERAKLRYVEQEGRAE